MAYKGNDDQYDTYACVGKECALDVSFIWVLKSYYDNTFAWRCGDL